MLYDNALWTQECRIYIPEVHPELFQGIDWKDVHAYVDDVVVKSQKADSLIADLTETFDNLRKYKMKLNPTKCVFGVLAGKLLDFIVSERDIEANPEKIKAIHNLQKPTCLKDVQKLTGCVASLKIGRAHV